MWKRWAARFADLWPTLPTGRGDGFMTAGARAELQWAQRAVLTDSQRIERPLLFLLSGHDDAIDAPLARLFAENLPLRAMVTWYPELPHDVFATRRVVDDLISFVATYRS